MTMHRARSWRGPLLAEVAKTPCCYLNRVRAKLEINISSNPVLQAEQRRAIICYSGGVHEHPEPGSTTTTRPWAAWVGWAAQAAWVAEAKAEQ